MVFHLLNVFFALAYLVLCALLAAVCVRARARALLGRAPDGQPMPEQHTRGSRLAFSLASCAALAAFLLIPLGSLPALLPLSWGAPAVPVCLALASGFAGEWRWDGAMRRQTCVLAFLGLSLALFAWYARRQAVPGEIFSLDCYVTTPLVSFIAMSRQGKLGIALLAPALLLAVRDVQIDLLSGLARVTRLAPDEARAVVTSALVRQIWILAVLGMAVCLFAPFSPAGWLGMSGITGTAADALFFWLKVLLVDHGLWLAADRFPQRPAWLPRAQALLAGLGALCLFFA